MPGCFALSCPKNFSAQSDPVLFFASDNKRLELEPPVLTPTASINSYCQHQNRLLFLLNSRPSIIYTHTALYLLLKEYCKRITNEL